MTPSHAATWMGTSYANQYDAQGRLVESVQTPYGDGNAGVPTVKNVYHEDGDGRCVRIESTTPNGTGVETRAYDADGRLTHSETTGGSSTRMQDYTYDDRGRLSSTTDTETNAPYIGQGGSVTSYSYLPDGSERIVIHDGFTDVGNMQDATETRTARCLEIDAQIGAPSDPRCRVE